MNTTNTSKLFTFLAIGFAALSFLLLLGAGLAYRSSATFLRDAISTTGTIIDFKRYQLGWRHAPLPGYTVCNSYR